MSNYFKKAVAMCLCIIFTFSCFAINTFALSTGLSMGKSYEFKTEYIDIYYNFPQYQTLDKEYHRAKGQLALKKLKSTGEPIYCLQPYKATNKYEVTAKSMKETYAWQKELTDDAKKGITQASIYGYPNYKYGCSDTVAQAATQMLIWEFATKNRTNFDSLEGSNPIKNAFNKDVLDEEYDNCYECYQAIVKACKNRLSTPSFDTKTLNLDGVGKEHAKTITDENGVLKDFDFSNSNGLGVSKSGNNLKVWATKANLKNATINLIRKCSNIGSALGLTGANQEMFYGSVADPVKLSLSVSSPAFANITITKKLETPSKQNETFNFTLTSKLGKDYTALVVVKKNSTTASTTVTGLPLGTYTISEKLTAAQSKVYQTPSSQSTELDSHDQTKTVEFTNKLNVGSILVAKNSVEGSNSRAGFTFILKNNSGKEIQRATTNVGGWVLFENVPFGTYFVEEELAPNSKYIQPNSQTITIENSNQIRVDFDNTLKKGLLKINKDFESGASDEKSGFTFNVTDKSTNKICAKLTTKKDGRASVELPFGTYIVSEVLTDAQAKIYQQPEDQEVVINDTANSVVCNFTNVRHNSYIMIRKFTAQDSKRIRGAKFGIYSDSDCNNKLAEVTTNVVGVAVYQCKLGTYYVKETYAPDYYEFDKNATPISAVLDAEDPNVVMDFINAYKSIPINFSKVSDDGGLDVEDYSSDGEFDGYKKSYEPFSFKVTRNDGEEKTITLNINGESTEPLLLGVENDDKFFKVGSTYTFEEFVNGNSTLYNASISINNSAEKKLSEFSWEITREIYDNCVAQGMPIDIQVTNRTPLGKLKIIKTADDGIVEGCKFIIHSIDTVFNTVYKTVTTNANGIAEIDNLPLGTYEVYEIDVPTRYQPVTKAARISITEGNVVEYTYNNSLKTDGFKITKSSEDGFLKGFEFEAVSECGKYRYTAITDENGVANFENVRLCDENNELLSYTVSEINTPIRYIQPDSISVVAGYPTADAPQDSIQFLYDDFNIHNELKKELIQIIKTSEDNVVENIEFKIYNKTSGELCATITTNEDGVAFVTLPIYDSTNNPIEYEVKETVPSYKYNSPESQTIILANDSSNTLFFYNSLKKFKIQINKIDADTGEKIVGIEPPISENAVSPDAYQEYLNTKRVKFAVYKDVNNNAIYEPEIDTLECVFEDSDKDGVYLSQDLSFDSYFVKEIETYVDYILDEQFYYVTETDESGKLREHGAIITISNNNSDEFLNKPIKGDALIQKMDSETYELLSGAEFALYSDVDCDGKFDDEKDTFICNFNENNGEYSVKDLRYGKYLVRETKAPEGFLLDDGVYAFSITKDGEVINVVNEPGVGFVNKPIKGSLKITKVDLELSNNKLSGAEFSAYKDINGNGTYEDDVDEFIGILNESDKKGIYTMGNLRYGKYLVRETKAPEGFLLDDGVYAFSVTIDGEVIDVVNKPDVGFVNKPIKGSLKITKVDLELPNNKLSGAEFSAYKDVNGNSTYEDDIDEFIGILNESDEKGIYTMDNLRYGKYLVRETKAPEGFLLDDGVYAFSVTIDGEVVDVVNKPGVGFVNKPIKGSLKITKVDLELPNNKLSGAEFSVYKDVNGNGTYEDDVDEFVGILDESDKKGTYTMGNLRYGKYLVRETKAPLGFVADENCYPFAITVDGELITISNNNSDEFLNKPIKGDVFIKKTDSETNELLSDAEFTLYSDVDCDGKFDDEKDAFICNFNENNGEYSVKGLRYGSYLVKETKAPLGFVADKNYYPFAITVDGELITISNNNSDEFLNKPIKGDVFIQKIDSETNELLSGAEFALHSDVNCDGKLDDGKDAFICNFNKSNGEYSVKGLRYGSYLVKETKAPLGYLLDDGIYAFSITKDGDIIDIVNKLGIGFVNKPIKGSLKITKVDLELLSNKLSGAEFSVYKDVNGNGIYEDDIDEFIGILNESDEKGTYTMDNLRYGKYLVRETKAPEGYFPNNTYYSFIISENEQVVTVDTLEGVGFTNVPYKGKIQLSKVDSEYLDLSLSGAEFTIYVDTNQNGLYDKDIDVEYGKLFEANLGTYVVEALHSGKYLLKETKAPLGYVVDENYYPFAITVDGELVTISNDSSGKFLNKPIKASLKITKVDAITNLPLEYVGFYLKNADGDIIDIKYTDENGIVTFDDLYYGQYYFQEFDAPDGYTIDTKDVEFNVVNNEEIIEFTVENFPIDDVDTGATDTSLPIQLAIFLSSILAFICYKQKR